MDHFNYKQGKLFAEHVPVDKIAEQVGTPAYTTARPLSLNISGKSSTPTKQSIQRSVIRLRPAAT
jgi:hypothetical protein